MKKVVIIFLLLVLAFTFVPIVSFADTLEDLEQEVADNLDKIDFSDVDDVTGGNLGGIGDKVMSIINGNFDGADTFIEFLTVLLGDSHKNILPKLTAIFAIIVITIKAI